MFMKIKVFFVILISLLLLVGMVLAGCHKDECKGTCKWNAEYSVYNGCDSVFGGRCYNECAAYKAFKNSPWSVSCDCP